MAFELYVQQARRDETLDLVDGLTSLAFAAVLGRVAGGVVPPGRQRAHMVSLCPDVLGSMIWILRRHVHMKEAAEERKRRSRVAQASTEAERPSTPVDAAACPQPDVVVAPMTPAPVPESVASDAVDALASTAPEEELPAQTVEEEEPNRKGSSRRPDQARPLWTNDIRFETHTFGTEPYWIVDASVGYHLVLPKEYLFLPLTVNTARIDYLMQYQGQRVSSLDLVSVTAYGKIVKSEPIREFRPQASGRRSGDKNDAETHADRVSMGFSRMLQGILAAGVSEQSLSYQFLKRSCKRQGAIYGLGPKLLPPKQRIVRLQREELPTRVEQILVQLGPRG